MPNAIYVGEEQRKSLCAGTKLATVNNAVRENPPLHDGAPVDCSCSLWRVISARCNPRRAAQILEHVLGFRRSSTFPQKVIRCAQGTYLFRNRSCDELVQRYPIRGSQFSGWLLHRCGKFQRIGVLTHFLILWSTTLGVITSISKSRAAGKKSRTLCVTMAEALPFTAASSTNSSAGSANCGRHIK